MPCNSGPSYEPDYKNYQFLDAALCALWEVLRRQSATDDEVIEMINFTEAGIHPDTLRDWRQHHDRKDELRRREEAESAKRAAEAEKRERVKAQAIKKLTPQELEALGLAKPATRKKQGK